MAALLLTSYVLTVHGALSQPVLRLGHNQQDYSPLHVMCQIWLSDNQQDDSHLYLKRQTAYSSVDRNLISPPVYLPAAFFARLHLMDLVLFVGVIRLTFVLRKAIDLFVVCRFFFFSICV